VIGKTDSWRWFEGRNQRGKTDGARGGLGLDVVPDYTNRSGGPSDLTRKKTRPQAKAWAKFPRPFGPIPNPQSSIPNHQSPITSHRRRESGHRSALSDLPYPDTRREPGQFLFLKIRNLHFAFFNGERTAGMKTATGRRLDR